MLNRVESTLAFVIKGSDGVNVVELATAWSNIVSNAPSVDNSSFSTQLNIKATNVIDNEKRETYFFVN